MSHSSHKTRSIYKFLGEMEGSAALEFPEPETAGTPLRVSTQKFLGEFAQQAKHLEAQAYPHHNRILAMAHALCDAVTRHTEGQLKARQLEKACGNGCDACCYYTEMDATGLEFEEIVRYIREQMPNETRATLFQQVQEAPEFNKHGHRPCPFLERSQGACTIYPVRPMGCRNLLATKRCRLEVEEDTGLELTVQLVQNAWKEMPTRAGALLLAQEQHRKGKGHANLNQSQPDLLVHFKKLEAERLLKLFA